MFENLVKNWLFFCNLESTMAACGLTHTVCLDDSGDLWEFGSVVGSDKNITLPRKIPGLPPIMHVSCSSYVTCAVDLNGGLWVFNPTVLGLPQDKGAMGTTGPLLVSGIPPLQSVQCGVQHALCLTQQGDVWGFGSNAAGELGMGDQYHVSPQQITGLSNITATGCCEHYSLIIRDDGSVLAAGENVGQFGLPMPPYKYGTFTQIPNLPEPMFSVATGMAHSIFLGFSGRVYACGNNSNGELGLGDTINRTELTLIGELEKNFIVKVSCGLHHSMFISDDNCLYVCGYNEEGRLGLGDTIDRLVPVKHTIVQNISAISSGGCHMIVKADGYVWASGWNRYSQLGFDDTEVAVLTQLPPSLSNIIGDVRSSRAKSARK